MSLGGVNNGGFSIGSVLGTTPKAGGEKAADAGDEPKQPAFQKDGFTRSVASVPSHSITGIPGAIDVVDRGGRH